MPLRSFYWVLLSTFIILWLFSACQRDEIFEGAEIPLELSLDTLRFDTVFTELGTITRFFKLYNTLDKAVIVDAIELSSSNTPFRINVDGIPGNPVSNTRIEANDSIYIFVEATIDPDLPLSISPFVIEEQINIRAGNSSYLVQVEAWGQNANYVPNKFAGSQINSLDCNGTTLVWDDEKPYVIYGVLALENCSLVISAGTEIYVHGGVAINEDTGIYSDGILAILDSSNIDVQGTAERPIIFSSDRLEPAFDRVQGQWAGILIQPGSRNNKFSHTIVRHSIVGVSVDSAAQATLLSCQFAYTSGSGLVASHAEVYAENCLFYQNEASGISLGYGGNYEFNHCTISNYENQGSALSASNFRCDDPLCQGDIFPNALNMSFTNCIFSGNDKDEISLSDIFRGDEPLFFNYSFENCIVTVEELLEEGSYPNFLDDCIACATITKQDTLFEDLSEDLYQLDSLSLIAIDQGKYIPGIDVDIIDNPRDASAVDVGCYEYRK